VAVLAAGGLAMLPLQGAMATPGRSCGTITAHGGRLDARIVRGSPSCASTRSILAWFLGNPGSQVRDGWVCFDGHGSALAHGEIVHCTRSGGSVFVAAYKTASSSKCPTFRGPGDPAVHSGDFYVTNVSCSAAKPVVERCRTDGTPCRVARETWRCRRTGRFGPLGFKERCASGVKSTRITWFD
jgi:hypothetical protein